jgi:outer membrane protein TolC
MIRKLTTFIIASSLSVNAYALSMHDLFMALKKQPISKIDKYMEQSAQNAKNKAESMFFPKIYSMASYEHFNSPTNLRPVTPSESSILMKQGKPLPFSRDIKSIGVQISMPILSYSLFNMVKKAKMMHKSVKEKAYLNFLRNEAALVSLNAKLQYLEGLKKALNTRRDSIISTLKRIEVGVENGRIPEIQKIKIESGINQIDIKLGQIQSTIDTIKSNIKTLTSIEIKHSVKMEQSGRINESVLFAVKPLKYAVSAQKYNISYQKGKLLPSIAVKSNIFRKFGKGYNNDKYTLRNYASIGVYMQMPIFDKTIYADTQKAKSDYIKTKAQLEQLKIQLKSESIALNTQLRIINNSIIIAKKELNNQHQLIKYAKVAFNAQRMLEEEYLRYEDALLNAEASLLELKAKKWEVISKLAVMYGNNLEEIVK